MENGVDAPGESTLPLTLAIKDTFRVNYISSYLENVRLAIVEDKVNVKGYFVWSMVDNFEWANGYTVRFGITYVDYAHNQTRYLKDSFYWYRDYIAKQKNPDTYVPIFI